jgi:predicted Zn-dependent protease
MTATLEGFGSLPATEEVLGRADDVIGSCDADELEICLLGRAGQHTRFAGDRIHQPQDITETQFLVRAVVDGHARRTATSDVADLRRAADQATAAARRISREGQSAGTVTLAEPDGGSGIARWWNDDVLAFDNARRGSLARSAMAAAGAAGAIAAGMYGRALTQQVVVNSRGVRRADVATEAHGAITVTAEDGSARWVDLGRSAERLQVSDSAARALEQALRSRGRTDLPPGRYRVVLGPEATGELLHFLPALGFSGSMAASGLGLVAQRPGEAVAAECVTVVDDAGADVGLPIGCDIEGVSRAAVPLLSAGVVGSAVTDLATAARLGLPSNGHAHIAREEMPSPVAANIVMSAGGSTEADLIDGVEDGVYLQRFWYTRLVDMTTGTITGVTRDACFRIRDGRLGEPIAGLRFTQSILDFLASVDGVGDTLVSQTAMNVWNGAASAPAVRGSGFRLGFAPERRS